MNLKIQAFKKPLSIAYYVLYLVIAVILLDVLVLHNLLGYGYPRHYAEENYQRYPAPYVAFTGKPNVLDHNEFGFRGASFKEAEPGDLKVAFFGGSTGYLGDPPIAKIVEKYLEKLLDTSIFVANYSVVSSNHRQHLHGIIEFLPQFKPDLVIFYGGYNETLQSAYYDPRPGYPFNYFYRSETRPFFKLLLENSAIAGEIDKVTGVLTGINKLRVEQQPISDDWDNRIAGKYYQTLELANNVTRTIESKRFGKSRFFAFYQPYQVIKEFSSTHNAIKKHISALQYAFDVSSEYEFLGNAAFLDVVHVSQSAKQVMGHKIAYIIASELSLSRRSRPADP